jgi:hypothetical protein
MSVMSAHPLDLKIALPLCPLEDAKGFLRFLRRAARKHSVTISFTNRGGRLTVAVPAKERLNLDSFLQELFLTGGPYFYLCSVPNRRQVARSVVKPIFQELLITCFSVAYPVLIHQQLLKGSPIWSAGEYEDGFAQQYELLFRRFTLKMISSYEFVRDLDDLLTEFMLIQLEHNPGDASPRFNVLVDMCGKQDILRDKEVRKLFNRIHLLRTRGLHRLQRAISDAELQEISRRIDQVFWWLDEYWKAQREKTVVLCGRRYRRVRFGQEMRHWLRDPFRREEVKKSGFQLHELPKQPCHDCDVIAGELHLDGCDYEVCPRCAGQYMCCDCRRDQDDED